MKRYLSIQEAYRGGKLGSGHDTADGNPVYWGNRGAGIILVCEDEILLGLRSAHVNEPHTWSYPGGKLEEGEDPKESALRELGEEINLKVKLKPSDLTLLNVFEDKDNHFKYFTYIVRVAEQITPKTDWENDKFEWFSLDKLPRPLHFGFKEVLPKIKRYMAQG